MAPRLPVIHRLKDEEIPPGDDRVAATSNLPDIVTDLDDVTLNLADFTAVLSPTNFPPGSPLVAGASLHRADKARVRFRKVSLLYPEPQQVDTINYSCHACATQHTAAIAYQGERPSRRPQDL